MIEINNFTKFSVDKKFVRGVAKNVLRGENRGMENLSIAFITPLMIKKINKLYRKKNEPTDILSFERISNLPKDFNEIVICPAVLKNNAAKEGVSFKKELTKMLIHGILHIVGYDHEVSNKAKENIFVKQEYYLYKFKF